MGASGTDILLSAKALEVFPFSIECKCQEKLNLWDAWEQTKENSTPDQFPLLIVRKNHTEALAIVDAEFFFRFVAEAVKNG